MDYQRLSERVEAIRNLYQNSEQQKEYDELPFFMAEIRLPQQLIGRLPRKCRCFWLSMAKMGRNGASVQ